jgi:hypothetical protein
VEGTHFVALCPFLKRISDESGEFICNGMMSLALNGRFLLETTKGNEERGAVVGTEARTCGSMMSE